MIEFWCGAAAGWLVGVWCAWSYGRGDAAEQCILDMLAASREPMYGLDMVEDAGSLLGRGTVYVLLGRMQDRGLIKATAPDCDGRRRYMLARSSTTTGASK